MKFSKYNKEEHTELLSLPNSKNINEEIIYNNIIQRTSNITANIVAVFETWFVNFFPEGFFKTRRIQTQSTIADFKSFLLDIHKKKKEKPILVINPTIELVEDSLYTKAFGSMYNDIETGNDIGYKLLYSDILMQSDIISLHYRKSRYKHTFEIMMIEKSLGRQLDLYNHILMNFRHNSKFELRRNVLNIIPFEFIRNIALYWDMDYTKDDFLDKLNSYSSYPIIKRLQNDKYIFLFGQEILLNVSVPSVPSKDSPENTGAIETGARVVFAIEFESFVPSEFILTIPEKKAKLKYIKDTDPENIYYIPDIKEPMDYRREYDDFKLANIIDINIDNDDSNSLDILSVLFSLGYEEEVNRMKLYIDSNSGKLTDLILIKTYINGTFNEQAINIENNILSIINYNFRKIYSICFYINYTILNNYRSLDFIKNIGCITDTK